MSKILVIDDDANDRLIIRKILNNKKSNFEVIEAKDGETGVELALEIMPDLILCDVLMPNMDGYQVLIQLRINEVTSTIPFIFLTAKNEISDLRKGMNLGADDYLVKPLEPEVLIDAVTTRLERFNLMKKHYTAKLNKTQEELNNEFNYDILTHLPNRFALKQQFNKIIEKWYKNSQQLISIIVIKLDNLEEIIYEFGYNLGDLLVKEIANCLVNLIGNDNSIAHTNYDEFVVILTPVTEKHIIETIVVEITQELSQVFEIENQKILLKPKIGISLYPQQGNQLEELLLFCKIAINQIEIDNNNKYRFYNPT